MSLTSQTIYDNIAKHPDIHWNRYYKLIHSQSQIGWDQIKYCRFTHNWTRQQEEYKQEFPNPLPQQEHWLRYLIKDILQFAHIQWSARN
eukprot:11498492-Ditylum_brightwellii.AAC.1